MSGPRVWAMAVGVVGPEEYALTLAHTDADRKARAHRYRHRDDRVRSLLANALLRVALREVFDLDERTPLILGDRGKPFWPGRPDVHFSISHSGGWVACAVADVPVGVDVQRVRRPLERLARWFAPAEVAAVRAAPPDERAERFTEIWTRKESFIKATGEGLQRDLRSFSVPTGPGADQRDAGATVDGHGGPARLRTYRPDELHVAAACALGEATPADLEVLDRPVLIDRFVHAR